MNKRLAVAAVCSIGSYAAAWHHMPLTMFGAFIVGCAALLAAIGHVDFR